MTKAGGIKIRTSRQHFCSSVSSLPPIGNLFPNLTFISIILCGAPLSPISSCCNQFFPEPQPTGRETQHTILTCMGCLSFFNSLAPANLVTRGSFPNRCWRSSCNSQLLSAKACAIFSAAV